MKRTTKLMVLLLILLCICACDIEDERIWSFKDSTTDQGMIRVNALTCFDNNEQQINVQAIVDVFDKNKKYNHTTIFHIKGDVENTPSIHTEDGPLTILTDKRAKELSEEEQELIKLHVINQIEKLYKERQ